MTTPLDQLLRTLAAGASDTVPLVGRLGGAAAGEARPLFDRSIDRRDLAAVREHPEVRAEVDSLRDAAVRSAIEEIDQEIATLRAKYGEAIETLAREANALPRVTAEDVVDLAIAIATEIARATIATDRDRLVELVDESIGALGDEDGAVTVRMNPEDFEAIDRSAIEGRARAVADESLGRGDVVVQSPRAMVESTVEAAIGRLREPLVALLEQGQTA